MGVVVSTVRQCLGSVIVAGGRRQCCSPVVVSDGLLVVFVSAVRQWWSVMVAGGGFQCCSPVVGVSDCGW